ncbi:MAG: nucleosidase, partial [Bacteroidaceae bacterium]|nr:nucleosidase [Bacteroidaceae bacterium]
IDLNIPNAEIYTMLTHMGKIAAVGNLMKKLYEIKPDYVLNIGTAGTLNHNVGDIIVSQNYVDRNYQKLTALHMEWQISCTFGANKLPSVVGGKETFDKFTVNTGDDFVTTGEAIAGDIVDMEGYAQAWACREMHVPLLSVKYITDILGQNSVQQWEEKLAAAQKGLTAYFDKYADVLKQQFNK